MSSFFLKILALIFMIIDHAGFIVFTENILLRIIGRLAFPIFAYQMAVGFSHTKNKEKHILKLLLFGILCQIPTIIIHNMFGIDMILNIIFTFVFSLLIIYSTEKLKFWNSDTKEFKVSKFLLSLIINISLLIIGCCLNVDYGFYGILLTVSFYFTLNKKVLSILSFFLLVNFNFFITQSLFSLFAYVSLFDIIFILLFNGKRGYKNSWIFYALYLFHFFPLILLRIYMLQS